MKKAFAFNWIITGLIVGLVVIGLFLSILNNIFTEQARQDANKQFSDIYANINTLCKASSGEETYMKAELPDIVEAIYTTGNTKIYPKDIDSKIRQHNTSLGNNLCMKLKEENPKCKKLDCETELSYLGQKNTVLSLADKILKRSSYTTYPLDFTRQECGIHVLSEGTDEENLILVCWVDPIVPPTPPLSGEDIILWDTNIPGGETDGDLYYQMKDSLAWANRENWYQVPYGTTDYTFVGDPIIDDGNFWLHLHSCNCNSPMLYAAGSGELYGELYGMSWYPSGSPECIPDYWPDGSARCGFQNMYQRSVTIVKNEPDEVIMIQDAGGSWPDKNVAQFRVKANAGWLEETAKTPGADYGFRIHYAPNRWAIAPANDGIGNDYIIDPRKDTPVCHTQSPPKKFTPPPTNNQFALYYMLGTTFAMLIPSDPAVSGPQIITTSYEPQSWADCEPRPKMESIGTGKTLMGQNAAYIAPMPLRNIFKNAGGKDGINTHISAGDTYTVSWTPSVPGKYRMTGRVNVGGTVKTKTYTCDPTSRCPVPNPVTLQVVEGGTPVFKTTEVTDGNFVFTSPVSGILEDVVIYLYDRTAETPADIQTPMDVYRDIMAQ